MPRDDETTPETLTGAGDGEPRDASRRISLGFVILWSSDEPDCLGAWLPVADAAGDGARVLGRGAARADDEHPRLTILQQRPERNERLPPLTSQNLSRSQLIVRSLDMDALDVVNLGRRRLFVNGVSAVRHEVRPGDILEIGSRLALLCTKRPQRMAGSPPDPRHAFAKPDEHGFVGESPAAWRLRTEVAFAARRTGHVLILGATGTGKELVARAIHALSGRTGALVSRNAATLPESLVDAELFGNPKGYPNPGVPERIGLIGAAHQGSLFLDEFADLPSGAQAHILRVLDSGEYQRLGESQQRRSDFRLIAATNRPENLLRPDLLARFDFRILAPELAARREDIPLLLRHLFTTVTDDDPELRGRYSLPNGLPKLAEGFVRRLVQHSFPANVRELRQLLWRALSDGTRDALDWPSSTAASVEAIERDDLPRTTIQRALDENNGSIEKTWRSLGLSSRYVLRRLISKYGLAVKRQSGGTVTEQ
jgi:two-component system nitrogen regulation response regulator GlnG/two-component system response regulator HydG